MSEVLTLNSEGIKELLSMTEVLQAVEHAFKLQAEKKAIMPHCELKWEIPNKNKGGIE